MKKTVYLLAALLLIQNVMSAQTIKSNKEKSSPLQTAVIDSAIWRQGHYVINRDSAYADPRIAIKKLMGGNKRFVEGKSIRPRQDAETIKKLENRQQPFATIVGCSDSRMPNEMIFEQGLGDLFIVRTAGQVSAAASYRSMEIAALKLKTKLIVVLGHTDCGAVATAVARPEDVPGHTVTFINEIKPSVVKSAHLPGNAVNNAAPQNVIDQVMNLRNLEPILHKKYTKGELLIVGTVYNIHTGKVKFLQQKLQNLPQLKTDI